MNSYGMSDKKNEIIAKTWEYMLNTCLTDASIGDLCKVTKLSQSSLYYWFKNKEEIWIAAGMYGLSKVVDEILDFTLSYINNPKKYFEVLLQEIDKYKDELRCVIQITVSSVYGKRMRETMKGLNNAYADYAKKLVGIFNCTIEQAEIFIYSTLSFVIDCVVWEDVEKTQMLLDNLSKRVMRVIGT